MQTLVRGPHSDKSGTGLDEAASSVGRTGLGLVNHALPWRPGRRNVLVLLLFVGVCAWFWAPLVKLVALALGNEHFSHVLLIPALTCYLLFLSRTVILTSHAWSPMVGALVMTGAAVCYRLADGQEETPDRLAVLILAFVVMCWGLFLFSFGAECFRTNLFSLVMLLFMVPFPTVLLDAVIGFLQHGSAEATDVLFSILGVPVFREGFVFSLSDFTIYIAEECSGIRSALALFITSLAAGHLILRSTWGKMGLVSIVIPLTIVKNAVRIVGLSLLANYVDPSFITDSALHRNGGIPFFVLSLAVLFSVVWLLRKIEQRFGYAS
ncbi:MAG: exosortase/archaeosortase family protein [Nitrospira sp.]|nr:exosortase/archaeosortase family protein [Nitrospira sp.]